MTANHGGKRNGSGNKPGSKRVAEKRKPVSLYVIPSIINEFKRLYGLHWFRAIEDFMKQYIKQNTRQE